MRKSERFEQTALQIAGTIIVLWAILVLATDQLEEPVATPEQICNCAGDPSCGTAVYAIDAHGDQLAYCALWQHSERCCEDPPTSPALRPLQTASPNGTT